MSMQSAGHRVLLMLFVTLLVILGCGASGSPGDPRACAATALDCGAHGTCSDATGTAVCGCDPGFTGALCDACLPEHFGSACTACTCVHGVCHDGIGNDGACDCSPPFGGASCDVCAASNASAIFLYNVGYTPVADMSGSRTSIDAIAQAALPLTLPTTGATTYKARGFISMTGDAIRDFPINLCVPSGVPVLGVGSGGTLTSLADSWADFMDGTIQAAIGTALGFPVFNYFWTGSNTDGSASGHDCSGWSTSVGSDASISRRAGVLTDWLQESGDFLASCNSWYFMLGLAQCVGDCPP